MRHSGRRVPPWNLLPPFSADSRRERLGGPTPATGCFKLSACARKAFTRRLHGFDDAERRLCDRKSRSAKVARGSGKASKVCGARQRVGGRWDCSPCLCIFHCLPCPWPSSYFWCGITPRNNTPGQKLCPLRILAGEFCGRRDWPHADGPPRPCLSRPSSSWSEACLYYTMLGYIMLCYAILSYTII